VAAACTSTGTAGGGGGITAAGGPGAAGFGGIATAAGGVAIAAGGCAGGAAGGFGGITTGAGGLAAATEAGVTNLGAGGSTAGFAGAAGLAGGGATETSGFVAAGGIGGAGGFGIARGGAWAAASFCWIARSTSPGREMCERSIFVLISLSGRAAREDLAVGVSSACALKCLRTNTASCSSRELECVFFSVTPTSGSASRIALLLTSSSRARSLIRILLIHPLASRNRFPPKLSCQPHGLTLEI